MRPPSFQPLASAVHVLLTFLVFCIGESVVWLWSLAGSVPLWVQLSAHVIAVTFLLKTFAIGVDDHATGSLANPPTVEGDVRSLEVGEGTAAGEG